MDDDKDGKDNKTIFEKITDAFNNVVDTAAAAATKAMDPDPEKVAGKANEQVLVGDAAIAPESVPPVEENYSRPMTADEIAHHAAADTQPIVAAKKTPKKKAVIPSQSGRITPTYDFPVPDTPMPAQKKPKAVKKAKKSAKKSARAAKKSSQKAVKKSKAKKSGKTSSRKSKKAAKTTAKKSSNKGAMPTSPERDMANKAVARRSKRPDSNEPMTGRQISNAMARKKAKKTAQKRAAKRTAKKSTKSKKTSRNSNR